MSNNIKRLIPILIFLLIIVLAGCKDKKVASQRPLAKQPKQQAVKAPLIFQEAEIKAEQEIYIYNPRNRRDPFKSLIEDTKERLMMRKGLTPMESYDIDEIKLIAIAWDSEQYYAMITLPDNKSYTVKRGMTLGIYGGKIVDITEDKMIVSERFKDYRGQLKTKDTILRLRKEEEE